MNVKYGFHAQYWYPISFNGFSQSLTLFCWENIWPIYSCQFAKLHCKRPFSINHHKKYTRNWIIAKYVTKKKAEKKCDGTEVAHWPNLNHTKSSPTAIWFDSSRTILIFLRILDAQIQSMFIFSYVFSWCWMRSYHFISLHSTHWIAHISCESESEWYHFIQNKIPFMDIKFNYVTFDT